MNNKFTYKHFSVIPLLCISFILVAMTSCSKKIHFQNSAVVPAAEGTIKVKKDNNNNYAVAINVVNLAPPDKLTPPKKTYVVWLETKEHGQKNIGQLSSSSGLFSSALKGSLKTVTAYEPVSFFITAEDDGARTYPGLQIIMESGKIN